MMPHIAFDWTIVPAGEFRMGSVPPRRDAAYSDEMPRHRVDLSAFRLSRTPITNAQYALFVQATGYPAPSHWEGGGVPMGREPHPVTYIDWDDAQAFCQWAGVRLPTEAEWERAARGIDGRTWPWGDQSPDASHANFAHNVAETTEVTAYPVGASPEGVLDLAGNVWEWTSSLYRPYPYRADDGREDNTVRAARVVRGGVYTQGARDIRGACRHAFAPGGRDVYIGLRVVEVDYTLPPAETRRAGETLVLDWVTIPAGSFWMGNDATADTGEIGLPTVSRHGAGRPADFDNELPQHTVYLPTFNLSRGPVTNAQYALFVQATGYPAPSHWAHATPPADLADHPVTYVDWQDAQAFCAWAAVRLPTEAEWEKVARSTEGRPWPWGWELPDATRANFGQIARQGQTTPVGHYPAGASPYGALDMAGNVWEWVSSLYWPYPYQADDGREDPTTAGQRVLRGGSFYSDHARYLRGATRSMSYPGRRRDHIGFRVVRRE